MFHIFILNGCAVFGTERLLILLLQLFLFSGCFFFTVGVVLFVVIQGTWTHSTVTIFYNLHASSEC